MGEDNTKTFDKLVIARDLWDSGDIAGSLRVMDEINGEIGDAVGWCTPEVKAESEAWLRAFCANHGDCPRYERVMAVISDGAGKPLNYDTGHSYERYDPRRDDEADHWPDDEAEAEEWGSKSRSGWYTDTSLGFYTDAYGEIPPEFWDHAENVLGRRLRKRPTYFDCSC